MGRSPARWLVVCALLALPLLLFHRALFLGEAFVPADLLQPLYPYKTALNNALTAWNVLRFDGITQFYPWRLQVAREWSTGHVPLWNPYQFAADGGTPLLANSQSAPFYPPNLLFLLCYRAGIFWYAFGLSAALHLFLAATGTYALLRSFGLVRVAALFGSIAFVLSGPLMCWLALPTFLAVSSWIPLLLLLIRRAHQLAGTGKGLCAGVGAGAVAGTMLLAGHLQMALYGLLCAGLFLLWEGHFAVRVRQQISVIKWVGAVVLAGIVMVGLAMPQVLPALELSRISHRAVAGHPTIDGYNAFVASALPVRNLVTFLVPDFFGYPNHNNGFYWNSNNFGEWAVYIGVAPLLLAVFALALPYRGGNVPVERVFFGGLFAFSLLMAMGTPVNMPFFFLVPGFSQLGNPARILAVTVFALAALAAIGLHSLFDDMIPLATKRRAIFIAVLVPVFAAAIGASQATGFAAQNFPQATFAELLANTRPHFVLPGIGLIFTAILLFAAALFGPHRKTVQLSPLFTVVLIVATALPYFKSNQRSTAALLCVFTVFDLTATFADYNPTAKPADIYPVTPGIAYLQQNAKDALIAPLNRRWSLSAQSPQNAVLPPNALTVYALHDIGGYDSLFKGASKEHLQAAGGEDPAPPENGNMMFVKSVDTALKMGAMYLIAPPTASDLSPAGVSVVYSGQDMVVYRNPNGKNAPPPPAESHPSFSVGLIGGIIAVLLLTGVMAYTFSPKRQ